jgi:hypothetical protein
MANRFRLNSEHCGRLAAPEAAFRARQLDGVAMESRADAPADGSPANSTGCGLALGLFGPGFLVLLSNPLRELLNFTRATLPNASPLVAHGNVALSTFLNL